MLLLSLFPCLVLVFISPVLIGGRNIGNDEKSFQQFIDSFKKTYSHNSTEYHDRFLIFRDSLKRHELLNNNQNTTVYGINRFSDLTPTEFQELYLTTEDFYHHAPDEGDGAFDNLQRRSHYATPSTWDWRDKDAVTSIVDQESCGACWAISVTECLESQWKISGNNLPSLSIQQLTDCSNNNQGCSGGDICQAAQWLNVTRSKIVESNKYPFAKKTTVCKTFPSSTWGVSIRDYACGRYDEDEAKILSIVSSHGPVAVAVDASSWQDYIGGIIQYHCGSTRRNHAVQIVGYNISSEIPFYIVRNSWGSGYGHQGYLYVKYGGNVCGIALRVASLYV